MLKALTVDEVCYRVHIEFATKFFFVFYNLRLFYRFINPQKIFIFWYIGEIEIPWPFRKLTNWIFLNIEAA